MPELPEVETVVRRLRRQLRDRELRELHIVDRRLGAARLPGSLRGARVRDVVRCGKELALGFAVAGKDGTTPDRRFWLVVHLRMTGRLLWRDGSRGAVAPGTPHARARLVFDRGVLDFVDARRFGTLRWEQTSRPRPAGVDPLARGFTPERLRSLLAGSRQPLKAWLVRQDRLAGLGNIYASEVLFAARLHPLRKAGSLEWRGIVRLHAALGEVLRRAVRHGGTTLSDFLDPAGRSGRFQSLLAVYGREGKPCVACGARIRRLLVQQRSTFYCPRCQPRRG